jgi:hypothetical protein
VVHTRSNPLANWGSFPSLPAIVVVTRPSDVVVVFAEDPLPPPPQAPVTRPSKHETTAIARIRMPGR